MDAEPQPPPPDSLAALFQLQPLPRGRAIVTVICAGTALLAAGGLLEYGTGSPETSGAVVAAYWALFFGLHTIAFGGAALLGGFPALAQRPIKRAWVGLCAALYIAAFVVWFAHQSEGASVGAWLVRSLGFLPAALAMLLGLGFHPSPPRAEP